LTLSLNPLREEDGGKMEAVERIAAIKANPAFEGLSQSHKDFVDSVEKWVKTRPLSIGQEAWVERIEKALKPVDNSWFDPNDEEFQKKRAYAIKHYKATGYYITIVSRMEADNSYMPDKELWDRMWSNKYINAAFKRWTVGARFKVGDMVVSKYYPASFGNIALVENVLWNGSEWIYSALPMNPAEHYAGRKIEMVPEKHFLPATPRNLKNRV
jgi:hypothetical protein